MTDWERDVFGWRDLPVDHRIDVLRQWHLDWTKTVESLRERVQDLEEHGLDLDRAEKVLVILERERRALEWAVRRDPSLEGAVLRAQARLEEAAGAWEAYRGASEAVFG